MIKYRIVYLGDDKYLAWDADAQRFIPAGMHLYVTTWDNIDDCLREMREVKRKCSGWYDSIYVDSVNRDPIGEHRPEVKQYF